MTIRPQRRRGVVAVLLATAVTALAACGGDRAGSDAGAERPVTDEEAGRIAETLFHDLELGGASFELNAKLPDDTTIRLEGDVDWSNHRGQATVEASAGPEAEVTEVVWADDRVIERVPALTDVAAQVGAPSTAFYVRSPDVDGRELDALIQVVSALAADQRDNAVLVAHEPGTAWLRSDTAPAGGQPVDVFRFGETTVFWIEEDGFTLHRFEGNDADATRPVVVDLSDHGERSIEVPADDEITPAGAVAELYEAATGVAP